MAHAKKKSPFEKRIVGKHMSIRPGGVRAAALTPRGKKATKATTAQLRKKALDLNLKRGVTFHEHYGKKVLYGPMKGDLGAFTKIYPRGSARFKNLVKTMTPEQLTRIKATPSRPKAKPRPMGPSARRIPVDPHIQRARRVPVDPHIQRAARKRQHPEVLSKSGYRTAPRRGPSPAVPSPARAGYSRYEPIKKLKPKKATLKKGKSRRKF